jgi:hypothetical protein
VAKFHWPGRGPTHTCVQARVNPGEHFGLSEIGPVELTGRVWPCPELDHHRARWSLVVVPRAEALGCELLEGRGHDDPEPPIGGADARPVVWRPRRRFRDHRGQADGSSAEADRVSPHRAGWYGFPDSGCARGCVEGGPLTRWAIQNSVPDILDIPDGLVHLIHGVADLAARGVIAH